MERQRLKSRANVRDRSPMMRLNHEGLCFVFSIRKHGGQFVFRIGEDGINGWVRWERGRRTQMVLVFHRELEVYSKVPVWVSDFNAAIHRISRFVRC